MKTLSGKQLAWLAPITILVHQLEEYFAHFPLWYSNLLDAELSNQDFIMINAVGLLVFTTISLSYLVTKNKLTLGILGAFIFLNGVIHLLLSIFTFSYSPGTISGLVLFIPLGIIIFKKIFPLLSQNEKILAFVIGFLILLTASTVATNI
jgi:hypothetical protein